MDIHKQSVRAGLRPRREPYFRTLRPRHAVGYRAGPDTWIARYRDESGRVHHRSLGAQPDYAAAVKAAEEWFTSCNVGVVRSSTVWDACELYVDNLRAEGRADAAFGTLQRCQRIVQGAPLGAVKLDRLRPLDIIRWRDSLRKTRKAATVNRELTILKAALNHAFKLQLVPSDTPWRVVSRLPEERAHRGMYLTVPQRKALLAHSEPAMADFIRGLFLTAARPGDLRRACVRDYERGVLTLRTNKGRGAREYAVTLTAEGRQLFDRLCADKLPAASIFSVGSRAEVRRPFAAARERAGLPANVVPYTIRHTAISDRLLAGIDIGTVAKMAGTSVAVISETYHQYVPSAVADKLEAITMF